MVSTRGKVVSRAATSSLRPATLTPSLTESIRCRDTSSLARANSARRLAKSSRCATNATRGAANANSDALPCRLDAPRRRLEARRIRVDARRNTTRRAANANSDALARRFDSRRRRVDARRNTTRRAANANSDALARRFESRRRRVDVQCNTTLRGMMSTQCSGRLAGCARATASVLILSRRNTYDPGGDRTRDLRIKSPLLYQLSYRVSRSKIVSTARCVEPREGAPLLRSVARVPVGVKHRPQ